MLQRCRSEASVTKLRTVNCGVKIRADLGVLRLTSMPAILVEAAFIDNAADAALLADRQPDFARAIHEGICDYLGVQPGKETDMIYNYIDGNMPEWARPTIQKLVDKGYLRGNEHGELGLTDTMFKVFVVNDRAGVYDMQQTRFQQQSVVAEQEKKVLNLTINFQ